MSAAFRVKRILDYIEGLRAMGDGRPATIHVDHIRGDVYRLRVIEANGETSYGFYSPRHYSADLIPAARGVFSRFRLGSIRDGVLLWREDADLEMISCDHRQRPIDFVVRS
ncbi:hypothetical protein CcrSwift_gp316 [Caulobacter phage CcrSwift]|uniref:Uncharacterized protein n=1 Tax=Caulobacter phage CcrSwift TaxID=2927984 RepID=K4JTE4_9CAUD|nr:hypothetical protein D870_gp105 [Caulobacter phage CcrSwift]AFU88634.1 hypothetical protein CcrSwift_gp316 [Caulobacter phage CcrSwift]